MKVYETHFLLMWMAFTLANEITITPHVKDMLIAYGVKETIRCSITVEDRNFDLYWNFSHHSTASIVADTVEEGDSFIIITDLNFQEFTPFDAGCFKCVAPLLHKEESICLHGVIERKISAIFNYQDMVAALHCLLDFDHAVLKAVALAWYLNGKSVLDIDKEKYFFDPSNGTLIIRKPRRIDTGKYTVKYEITTEKGTNMFYTCSVDYFSGPLVLNMPKSKNVFIGSTLELICAVISYPPSDIVWVANDVNITMDDHRVQLEEHSGHKHAKLTISHIKIQDAGVYTCTANSSRFNSSSKSILVRVKNPYEWVWPFLGIIIQVGLISVMVIICSHADKAREKRAEETLRRKMKRAETKSKIEEELRKRSTKLHD